MSNINTMPDPEMIDDDAPEVTADMLKNARRGRDILPELIGEKAAQELFAGDITIEHVSDEEHARRIGRPPLESPKKQVTLRLDADIIDAFRAGGKGWQTRINDALRASVEGN